MQANPRNLDDLFNLQIRYVVPMFQRNYVWEADPQWRTLWEDIAEKGVYELNGTKSNPHYLGALILEGVKLSQGRDVKRFLVIDGQQRLTTLQLLFCAFRDLAKQKSWNGLDRKLHRYLINEDAERSSNPGEEQFKIWPTTLNRDIFCGVITAGSVGEVEKRYPLVKKPRKRKPEPRSNLVDCYVFFFKAIATWVEKEAVSRSVPEDVIAEKLLMALREKFCLVEISLSEGDDSQEIFYSLNSQGRPLSQSDLLRSLIFMRAEKEQVDRDAIFEKYWSEFETPFWSAVVSRGARLGSRLDLGLRYFLTAKTGALIDSRRVNEEYRTWISATPARYPSIMDELEDFSRHCAVYKHYESQVPGLRATDRRRVLQELDVSTVLPLFMHLEIDAGLDAAQIKACQDALESFLVRRAFVGAEMKQYNVFFAEVITGLSRLRGSAVLPALLQKLVSGGGATRFWPTDAEVIEHALTRPVTITKVPPHLRLILERLEIHLRSKKAEDLDIAEGLQVEHVMPKQWGKSWPLKGQVVPDTIVTVPHWAADNGLGHLTDDIRQRNVALHTLGNLTLLNKYLNPSVSNSAYANKQAEYRNSVLRLNRYFETEPEWDEAAIARRGLKLAEAICQIWPRPIGQ